MTDSPINLNEAKDIIAFGVSKRDAGRRPDEEENVAIKWRYLDAIVEELVAARERITELEGRPKEGLYGKYAIRKTDGSTIDPKADYFILRLDTDPAARIAAREYALHTSDMALGKALEDKITKYFVKWIESDQHLKEKKDWWPLGEIKRLEWQLSKAIIPQAEDADSLHFMLDYLCDDPNDNRDPAIEIAKKVLHRYLAAIEGGKP